MTEFNTSDEIMNDLETMSGNRSVAVATNYGRILAQAEEVVPVDYLHPLSDVQLKIDEKGKHIRLIFKGYKEYKVLTFDDYSFLQFIKRLHPKADAEFLDILTNNLEVLVLLDLLNKKIEASRKKNPRFLFRTYRGTNRIFACLTEGYVPVNHSQLVKGFLNVVEKISAVGIEQDKAVYKMFQSFMSYRRAVVRIPIHKISEEGEGVFTGLEFSNAQDGSHRLTIRLMLFELICTNGMIGTTAEFIYMDRPHRGKFQGFSAIDLLQWYDTQKLLMEKVYFALSEIYVYQPFSFIEGLPKKYPLITEEILTEIKSALDEQGNVLENVDGREFCKAFNIVSAITLAAQKFKDERRFFLDDFAHKLAEKEWLRK